EAFAGAQQPTSNTNEKRTLLCPPKADILLVQTSVDLESEFLDNRRPESNVSGEGLAQFFRVRIENWFNAGVDQQPLIRWFGHRRACRLRDLFNELDWRPGRRKQPNRTDDVHPDQAEFGRRR